MPKMPKNQNLENLSSVLARYFEPFMLDGGSTKNEDKGIVLSEHQ